MTRVKVEPREVIVERHVVHFPFLEEIPSDFVEFDVIVVRKDAVFLEERPWFGEGFRDELFVVVKESSVVVITAER